MFVKCLLYSFMAPMGYVSVFLIFLYDSYGVCVYAAMDISWIKYDDPIALRVI